VLHKYRLIFFRAATFNSSGERIASYLAVGAPFSHQTSSFTNSNGVLSEVRSLVSGSVPFSYQNTGIPQLYFQPILALDFIYKANVTTRCKKTVVRKSRYS
jgi:hypothetical protein